MLFGNRSSAVDWLIVGLGNPGQKYEHTRHNMGFDVIDELALRWHVTLWKEDMKAEIGQTLVNGEKVLLVKPLTYMNNSGEAVGAIARYYKVDLDDIYIICDDLDLPPGKTRIRKKGASGGHNGIKSLIAHLGSENFNRFRIGVGHPQDGHTVVEHVLSRPYGEDIQKIEDAKIHTADSIESALKDGVDHAMNVFNPKRKG